MPDWKPESNQPVPNVPEPVVAQNDAARIPLTPGSSDASRPWSRDGAEMTPELAAETKPYLDAIGKMGAEYKVAHASKLNEKTQEKLFKSQGVPELSKNASATEREIHEKAAMKAFSGFDGDQNKAVHEATDGLRRATKDVKTPEQFAAVKESFNQQYDNLCKMAGRTTPSELEKALPENSPLRTKLDPLTGSLRDPSTGLYAKMTEIGEGPEAKKVIIFGGTNVADMLKPQLVADGGQFLGGVPKAYTQAAQLTSEVKANLSLGNENVKLETAGHSLGGGLAHFSAISAGDMKSTCFNAAALGGGCKAALGDKLDQAKNQVLHVNLKGDLVGDGLSQQRVPLQKAADTVRAGADNIGQAVNAGKRTIGEATGYASDKLDRAKQIGQMGMDAAQNRMAPATNAVSEGLGSAKRVGQAGVDAAKERVAPATNAVSSKIGSARNMGQSGLNSVKESLAPAANAVKRNVSSVGDALRGMKNGIGRELNGANQAIKESSVGKAVIKTAKAAKEAALTQYENLGISRGELAIPHQYGSCVTLDNNGEGFGKNNPLKNHLTNALAKAYAEIPQQGLAQDGLDLGSEAKNGVEGEKESNAEGNSAEEKALSNGEKLFGGDRENSQSQATSSPGRRL